MIDKMNVQLQQAHHQSSAGNGDAFETYRETTRKVAAAREKGYAAARENLKEAWSALAMVREAVETLAPSGSVKAAEHLDGPTFMHEAEALVAGIQAISAAQICGACGQPWTGEKCGQADNGWDHPVCYPAQPQEVPMRGPLIDVVASLAAAISLLERTPKAKKAAPSDKMFDQMLADYRKSLEAARATLALSRPAPQGTRK